MQRFSAEAGFRRPTSNDPSGSYRNRTSPLAIHDRLSQSTDSRSSTNCDGVVARPSSTRTRNRTSFAPGVPQVLLGWAGPLLARNDGAGATDFLTGTLVG